MSTTFETAAQAETKILMIENITSVGSAFGVTTSGAQTYINARIVDTVGLKCGDTVEALILPNYDDKRNSVPWRALRVTRIDSPIGAEQEAQWIEDESEIEEEPEVRVSAADQIIALITEHGAMRTAVIAAQLGMTFAEVSTLCMGLFAEQKLSVAEVYGAPRQKRASLRVWGLDVNDFDVDPSEEG